jgi:histone-lysine N-methyltransferase SETMAR
VPRELKDREKLNRMGMSSQEPLQYADEGEDMLNRIVMGMNHGCITTNLNQSALQCNGNIPVHLQPNSSKFKVTQSTAKVMLTVFWDPQGALLAHFQKHDENMNFASYHEVILKLRGAICRKHLGQLARRLLLHHDNIGPHTAQATHERIQELQWEFLEHLPYSLDLVPSDFHLFVSLKTTLVEDVSLITKRLKLVQKSLETAIKRRLCCGFSTHW